MSDYDLLLQALNDSGYVPETSADNIINNVIALFDEGEYEGEFTVEKCLWFVDATGGWKEFDSDF